MERLLLLLFVCCAQVVRAQFAIGTTQLTFHDDARGRDIPCQLYYPADVAGPDVAPAAGPFPTLVIGHGFVMAVDAYAYLGEHFAAAGYVVVLPTTEGGFAPDHAAFGQDLAFLPGALQAAGLDEASPFFGRVGPAAALLGHSMGGGAAVLGAAANDQVRTLVVLAPAETTPSAIAAAASVNMPTLVFAASADCVTPIAQHALPIYNADAATCKAFVNITGGGHCYFGDESLTCSIGEFTCGPDLTISRDEQHAVVLDVAGLWLDHYLRDLPEAFGALLDTLATSLRFTAESTCLSTAVQEQASPMARVRWDQTAHGLLIEGAQLGDNVCVYDATGRCLQCFAAAEAPTVLRPIGCGTSLLLVRMVRGGRPASFKVPVGP